MRNYFNIVRSVGLIFFGVGLLVLSLVSRDFIDRWFYGSRSMWQDGIGVFMLLGLAFFITGLAGLLKAKWFPKVGIAILVFAFFFFSWFMFTEVIAEAYGREEFLWVCALIGFVYLIILCFALLLNNEYFLDALGNEDIEPDEGGVLDA